MSCLATRSNGACGLTASIVGVLSFVVLSPASSRVDARTDIAPGTIVQRFLLTPEEIGIRVFVEMRSNEVIREWRNLLNTADSDILDTTFFASLKQSEIYLSYEAI